METHEQNGGYSRISKIAAVYDLFQGKGLCPDKFEDKVMVFYYGDLYLIAAGEKSYSIVLRIGIEENVVVEVLRMSHEAMESCPMVQVTVDTDDGNLYFQVATVFEDDGDNPDILEERLFARLDSMRTAMTVIFEKCGLTSEKTFDPIAVADYIKEAGFFPEADGDNGLLFEYNDIHYRLVCYDWGFDIAANFDLEKSWINERLINTIFDKMYNRLCKLIIIDEDKPYIRISVETGYDDWDNQQHFITNLKLDIRAIEFAKVSIAEAIEENSTDDDGQDIPVADEAVASELDRTRDNAFDILKDYGYLPEVRGNLIIVKDGTVLYNVEFTKVVDFDDDCAEEMKSFSVVESLRLDNTYDFSRIPALAFDAMSRYAGKCFPSGNNKILFMASSEYHENPEQFINSFARLVKQVRTMEQYFEYRLDEDTNDFYPKTKQVFNFLKDAGLEPGKEEENVVSFKFAGYPVFIDIRENGYIVYAISISSEEKHHVPEDEMIIANNIMYEAEDFVQICCLADDDMRGVSFSMFYDDLPLDNADSFITKLKSIAAKIDAYTDEFVRQLYEYEAGNKKS